MTRYLIAALIAAAPAMALADATPDQLARMAASLDENERVRRLAKSRELDEQLDESFPASDPPQITRPR